MLLKLGLLVAIHIILIIAQGLCSSRLFYLVNLYYSETSKRLILINNGIINVNSAIRIF